MLRSPAITADTGMDVLTHAIEAYIGKANTSKTKQSAILAVQLVNKYLYILNSFSYIS